MLIIIIILLILIMLIITISVPHTFLMLEQGCHEFLSTYLTRFIYSGGSATVDSRQTVWPKPLDLLSLCVSLSLSLFLSFSLSLSLSLLSVGAMSRRGCFLFGDSCSDCNASNVASTGSASSSYPHLRRHQGGDGCIPKPSCLQRLQSGSVGVWRGGGEREREREMVSEGRQPAFSSCSVLMVMVVLMVELLMLSVVVVVLSLCLCLSLCCRRFSSSRLGEERRAVLRH